MTLMLVWKATAILAAAWGAAALALPLASVLTPAWPAVTATLPTAVTESIVVTGRSATRSGAIPWLAILYWTGLALAAARFLIGAARTAWIVRRAAPPVDGVVFSADAPVPMAWGILSPLIVLPASACSWPADRLRSVLLHERMHHERRDLLTQAIAQAACSLYWFNPLAWLALARQRREREAACDDAVLRHGVAPHDYASHLVDVVRSVASHRFADAPAMAEAGSLESRVRAVLDRATDRRPLSRRAAAAVAGTALLLIACTALVNLRAQTGGSTITGIVIDPSGGRVPKARVTAKNLDGANEETTVANAAGEYRFAGIPAGRYALEFAAPGFTLAKVTGTLVAGATLRVDGRLEVGQVVESISVAGKRPGAAPQAARTPERIPIGGNVHTVRLIRQPKPVYPPELQQQGVEGTVVIKAIVSKEGSLLRPTVINSVDPHLAQAALDAVAQWQYEPALLNGQPIEVVTTIRLEFRLDP